MKKLNFSNKLFVTQAKIVNEDNYVTILQYDKIANKQSKILLNYNEILKICRELQN